MFHWTDGRIDRHMAELIVAFCSFANASKKCSLLLCLDVALNSSQTEFFYSQGRELYNVDSRNFYSTHGVYSDGHYACEA